MSTWSRLVSNGLMAATLALAVGVLQRKARPLHLRAINEADDEEDFMTGGENGGAGSGPDVRGGTQEERGAIERTPRPAPTVNAVAKRAPHRPVLRLKGY
jgi:hypothetical protein